MNNFDVDILIRSERGLQEPFVLSLIRSDGEETEIKRGLKWVSSTGVRVDPLGGDVIDG